MGRIREASKTRQWEKERRDRLSEAFNDLGKLLPCYVPGVTISKMDILKNSMKYIAELQEKVETLMHPKCDNASKNIKGEEIKKLQDRVTHLVNKNEQLCGLLGEAKITIPADCSPLKKLKDHRSWSNKILPEQVKHLQKRESEKENVSASNKSKARKFKNKVATKSTNRILKHRKQVLIRPEFKKFKYVKKIRKQSSKCVLVLSQPNITQPCYVITNAPSNNLVGSSSTVITNSTLLSNPLVSSRAKSSTSSLGPGTLILANGTVVPVLQQQTVLSLAPRIVSNPLSVTVRPSNPTVIVLPRVPPTVPTVVSTVVPTVVSTVVPTVTSSVVSQPVTIVSSASRGSTKIKPKYCMTRTTQVNKVPIPALTSRFANKDLVSKASSSNSKVDKVKNDKTRKSVPKEQHNSTETCDKRKLLVDEQIVEAKICKVDELSSKDSNIGDNKDTCEETKDQPSQATEESNVSLNTKDTQAVEQLVTDIEVVKNKSTAIENTVDSICVETTPCQVEVQNRNELQIAIESNEANAEDKGKKKIEDDAKTNSEIKRSDEDQNAVQEMKALELNLSHSELSNDIFASLQVPAGCQNPESTSPTAAFLLAFPLVSSLTGVKVTEVTEDENNGSQSNTPTLLQIGTMDTTRPTQTQTDNLASSLLNLDNLSFFSTKDICSSLYTSFDSALIPAASSLNTQTEKSTVKEHEATLELGHNSMAIQTKVPKENFAAPNPVVVKEMSNNNNNKSNNFIPTSTDVSRSKIPKIDFEVPKNSLMNMETRNNVNSFQNMQNSMLQDNIIGNNSTIDALIAPSNFNFNMRPKQNDAKNYLESKPACNNYFLQDNNIQPNTFNDLTKVSTGSHATAIKNYPEPLYSNSNTTYSYNYPAETNFNQNYYKNVSKGENRSSYYSLNYENYSDYRKNDGSSNFSNNCSVNPENKNKFTTTTNSFTSKSMLQCRPPINWMTAPDNKLQNTLDYSIPQLGKELDVTHNSIYSTTSFGCNPQTSYFNTNPTYSNNGIANAQDTRKNLDLSLVPAVSSYQRIEPDENQFSWSPTKIPQLLDQSHNFVSSTLPTLVGDLALGTSLTPVESKIDLIKQAKKDNGKRTKHYTNPNFLSVSQLVDHNKSEPVPTRTTVRRNSSPRSQKKAHQKSNLQKTKNQEVKDLHSYDKPVEANPAGKENINLKQMERYTNSDVHHPNNNDMFCQIPKNNRNIVKATSSNYSAEALIGYQMHTSDNNAPRNKPQHYPPATSKKTVAGPPPFLPDNLMSYFPPVDLPQENNYMQQSQNYNGASFSHNFSTFQNNTYTPNTFASTATTVTSTYLGTNSFMHDSGTAHGYAENLLGKEKTYSRNLNRPPANSSVQQNFFAGNPTSKKPKRKLPNENSLPGFVDFPFLTMPGAINSPILPDDFHTHSGFLQPPTPQLYPCKNPLYTKQNDLSANGLLPMSSVPRSKVGGVHHPEISPINGSGTSLTNFNLSTIFPEINKVTFSDKPNFSFSYINGTASQSYNIS